MISIMKYNVNENLFTLDMLGFDRFYLGYYGSGSLKFGTLGFFSSAMFVWENATFNAVAFIQNFKSLLRLCSSEHCIVPAYCLPSRSFIRCTASGHCADCNAAGGPRWWYGVQSRLLRATRSRPFCQQQQYRCQWWAVALTPNMLIVGVM